MNFYELQNNIEEQRLVADAHATAVNNLQAIQQYLTTVNDTEKSVIISFLKQDPNFKEEMLDTASNELLTGYVAGNLIANKEYADKTKVVNTFLSNPIPGLDVTKFETAIGSRRLLTSKACDMALKVVETTLSEMKNINVSKEKVDPVLLNKWSRAVGRVPTKQGTHTDAQRTLNKVTTSAQVVGALLIAGVTYNTFGWLGYVTFLDDVLVGSYVWLLGIIRNKIFNRLEKKEDAILAITPSKLGYTEPLIKKYHDKINQLRKQHDITRAKSKIDEVADDEDESTIDILDQIYDNIDYICYGCAISIIGIVDITKK